MSRKKVKVNWFRVSLIGILLGAIALVPITFSETKTYVYDTLLATQEDVIDTTQKGVVVVMSTDIINMATDEPQPSSLGTGFIIGENVILTNNHVVNQAKEVKVDFLTNAGDPYEATVKFSDPSLDVAVVELKEWDRFKSENDITILSMQEQYRLAQNVFTIGHAWGLYYSVSKGIISFEHRKMPDDLSPRYFIQTDAKVFEGNSGGPMINDQGEVLGMNTMIVSNTGGSYGFTVPSILINKALKDFATYGEIRWALIGVELKLNYVKGLIPDGPASLAGLTVGDKIIGLTVDGVHHDINSSEDIIRVLAASDYSSTFTITLVDQDGDEITLDITPNYKTAKDIEN